MKAAALTAVALIAVALCASWAGSPAALASKPQQPSLRLPWKAAGLTEREAAAHLLNRFSYGPRPGEIEKVIDLGLDRWLERQLAGGLREPRLDRLRELPALDMPAAEIARTYPRPGLVLAEARRAGVISGRRGKDDDPEGGADEEGGLEKTREAVRRWARQQGYRPQRELIGQLLTQKLYRAVEAENQLAEVMTDFWFNHFNVSLTDNQARGYLLSYERDAIRSHALGEFRDLLGATARHPAMLLYLDNAQSAAPAGTVTTLDREMERRPRFRGGLDSGRPGGRIGGRGGFGDDLGMRRGRIRSEPGAGEEPETAQRRRRPDGLNENYARELMELHTLGVDGGYTQADVVQVARAFTGWSLLPSGPMRGEAERRLRLVSRAGGMGFQAEGEFLFRADLHDATEKVVLGKRLPAGRGIEDGEDVLNLLAAHPSTARHLATKLAVRFVSDNPPKALIDRLAAVWQKSGGDTRAMLRAIAESPEFWSRDAVGAKIKSPFELAASALRATGARIEEPRAVLQWIAHMGQPLYAYQAPTGYPDRAEAWVNTGSLLNRMSFGLQFAAGRVDGVEMNLPALNGGREPGSRTEALDTYARLLLPGRKLEPVLQQLGPLVEDPELAKKVDEALPQGQDPARSTMMEEDSLLFGGAEPRKGGRRDPFGEMRPPRDQHPPTAVEQVVGVILGSPEFQRR